MKNSLVIIFLFLSAVNFKLATPDKTEYIEFIDIGSGGKYISPLFISKSKLDIKLDEGQIKELQDIQSQSISMTKEQFINLHYDLLVTDNETYAALLSFIMGHNEFYTNGIDRFNPAGSMDIIANGKTYSLFYKTEKDFLKGLINYLKEKNCDDKVIVRLGMVH